MDKDALNDENRTCPICGTAICMALAWRYCASKGGQRVCQRHCYQVCRHLYYVPCTKHEPAATVTPETYNTKGEQTK